MMRIVFMGTPEFSVPILEALVQGGHQVIAVVTQPDKPKGRGKAVQVTPVKEKALELGIPVYQPARARDEGFIEQMKELAPDVAVVVAFGQILSQKLLDVPRFGCINIHASLLPKYRGAAPIQWAVINGDAETGITTMQMDAGVDTGDMLEQVVIPIAPDETGGSLHDKLSAQGGPLILSTLKKLEEGTLKAHPQPSQGATHVGMLTKSFGDIDWSQDAAQIERLIRGLNPWPSAYTRLGEKTLKIWQAKVLDEEPDGAFGQVVEAGKDRFLVKTGKGVLQILSLQLEGKKRMDTEAFLRGNGVETGTILGSLERRQ